MNLAERAGMTVEDFIEKDIITTEYERKFLERLTKKQKEMYLVKKFVHQYRFIFGGKQEGCRIALNKFCELNGYRTRSIKSVSNIYQEPVQFHEFPDFNE